MAPKKQSRVAEGNPSLPLLIRAQSDLARIMLLERSEAETPRAGTAGKGQRKRKASLQKKMGDMLVATADHMSDSEVPVEMAKGSLGEVVEIRDSSFKVQVNGQLKDEWIIEDSKKAMWKKRRSQKVSE